MAYQKPPPDPTRATVSMEEPPPPFVPPLVPVPVNERPVRPVVRVVIPSSAREIPPVVAATLEIVAPPEMEVHLSRRTMIPEEGAAGAPPVPVGLKGVRTLSLGPAKITNAPPKAPPQIQKVALRGIDNPRFVADARSEPWIMSPDPLGKPVAVNGRMVAVYIAARVMDFFRGAEDGTWIVEVDLVFAPVTPGEVSEDWVLRYEQDGGELRRALIAGLYLAFSRLPLWPGLVVRFTGGPPMMQADADANRYHVWINEDRSPTRVEIDDRFVGAARDAADDAYLDGQSRFFTRLTVGWWKGHNPIRYRNYCTGKLLADRDDPPKLSGKALEALKTALSEYAGSVISSLSAVCFGNDADAKEALLSKGRQGVRPTEIRRSEAPRRPTYLEHEPLPDDAVVSIGDGED